MNKKLSLKRSNYLNFTHNRRPLLFIILLLVLTKFTQCKKLVEIPPPVSTITTSQVFEKDQQAVSAANGMYYNMINSDQSFASYSMTLYAGMSADEILSFSQGFIDRISFERNGLQSSNSIVLLNFWSKTYSTIYSANAIIEGLSSFSGVNDSVKSELIGEAKFVRAFCNFYLVNLFGDIPLVYTTNWHSTNLIGRTSVSNVYESIANDLSDAENRLASDYSVGKGERIIPNKWAAKALLARVYLYEQDWSNAEIQSSTIINNLALYSLLGDINDIFRINSNEAIWQLKHNNDAIAGTNFNATPEGAMFIPRVPFSPNAYLRPSLVGTFEFNDQRLVKWVDSVRYRDVVYYYPYKYKLGRGEATPNGPYTEYYMVLRLAEQYLIRAEARAMQNKLEEAVADLNVIRNRAGLPDYDGPLNQDAVMAAIIHENQIEFFAEWGHRWLDLKRWGIATQVLSANKGFTVSQDALLYPIPLSELQTDPNLTQNPGY